MELKKGSECAMSVSSVKPHRRIAFVSLLAMIISWRAGAVEPLSITERLVTGVQSTDDYGVVIGLESYPFLNGMDVAYAHRDAEAFRSLLIYTFGSPPDRVELLRDGSRSKIEKALAAAGERTGQDGTVWVYFSGHGAASSDDDERLLLGDAVRQDPTLFEEEAVRLDTVQALAGAGGARVIVVVDACYTGVGRDGEPLAPGAKYVPHSVLETRKGAMVWTGASSNEVANPLHPARHSAFTYFAVGALRGWADGELNGKRDGRVSAAEANQYVTRALQSAGMRAQTPAFSGEASFELIRSKKLESGPDLRALCDLAGTEAAAPEAGPPADDFSATVDALERARKERELAEQREEEVLRALAVGQHRQLAREVRDIQEQASADWLALADLFDAGGPEAVEAASMYITRYDDAHTTVGGVYTPVRITWVEDAKLWLWDYEPEWIAERFCSTFFKKAIDSALELVTYPLACDNAYAHFDTETELRARIEHEFRDEEFHLVAFELFSIGDGDDCGRFSAFNEKGWNHFSHWGTPEWDREEFFERSCAELKEEQKAIFQERSEQDLDKEDDRYFLAFLEVQRSGGGAVAPVPTWIFVTRVDAAWKVAGFDS